MKKWMTFLLLLVCVANAAGCASVQKKFTRKKKTPSHVAATIYLQEGEYQKKYSNDYYYKSHFTFWKTWQSELINGLGGNRKKVARSAQEALGHLTELGNYLIPEKKSQLQLEIDSLSKIVRKIESQHYSDSEYGGMRSELERIQRTVSNNFYYDKVKKEILPDGVDLGEEPSE